MRAAQLLRRYGLLALGLIGMVVGLVLLTRPPDMAFRFAAYAPLSNTFYVPPFFTGVFVLGGLLFVLGTALAAGWVGFALGRRAERPRHP